MKVEDFKQYNHFPKYPNNNGHSGITNFFSMLLGLFIWIFLIILFLFFAFVKILSGDIALLIFLITGQHKHIPYWIPLILALLFFPISLIFVLVIEFYKIITK